MTLKLPVDGSQNILFASYSNKIYMNIREFYNLQ